MVDVVVVGGGAAGCVAAARLSESASRSVLLLEAGPDLRADPPAFLHDGWGITRELDWGYLSEPDARGVVRSVWRNKVLGGTSWVTRFTPRGAPADYDAWEARGNPGWGFDDLLPAFVKLEADADFGDRPWHGDRGPMPSRRYLDLDYTGVTNAAVEAIRAVGFPAVEDHNEPRAIGVGRMPMSTTDGVRVTTADAYLPLGATPPNLEIRADAQVADVTFDGATATGVRLLDGTEVEAGWVVLCAGVYGTPPILMRSGIGPAEHLRALDVPVRIDLPGVGANLADHPGMDVDVGYRGPGRDAPVLHSLTTFHSSGTPSDEPPDLAFWVIDPTSEPGSFEFGVLLLKPRSRGSVRLRSNNPADSPSITLPALDDPSDVERLGECYRRAIDVANRPELRSLCAEPATADPGDDVALRARVRMEAYSVPHVVGTCALGSAVDASGRVLGTERLTVADASVMPDVPSGFTHVPTIMIAERLSEQLASLL